MQFPSPSFSPLRTVLVRGLLLALLPLTAVGGVESRCVVVDVFADAADPTAEPLVRALAARAEERTGLVVVRRFVDVDEEDRAA